MPEYVPLSNNSTDCGEDSSTDGGDDAEERGTLHLLFQNRRMSDELPKHVCSFNPQSLFPVANLIKHLTMSPSRYAPRRVVFRMGILTYSRRFRNLETYMPGKSFRLAITDAY